MKLNSSHSAIPAASASATPPSSAVRAGKASHSGPGLHGMKKPFFVRKKSVRKRGGQREEVEAIFFCERASVCPSSLARVRGSVRKYYIFRCASKRAQQRRFWARNQRCCFFAKKKPSSICGGGRTDSPLALTIPSAS